MMRNTIGMIFLCLIFTANKCEKAYHYLIVIDNSCKKTTTIIISLKDEGEEYEEVHRTVVNDFLVVAKDAYVSDSTPPGFRKLYFLNKANTVSQTYRLKKNKVLHEIKLKAISGSDTVVEKYDVSTVGANEQTLSICQ